MNSEKVCTISYLFNNDRLFASSIKHCKFLDFSILSVGVH